MTSLRLKSPPTTRLPTHPSVPIQGRGLISGPWSPAAICSSRTETRYLALCGLEMELFIRPTLLSAWCRLHYSLCSVWETISVSCFLHCYLLVVPVEMGLGSSDLSSSQRGSLIKNPTPPCAPSRYRLQEMGDVKKSHPSCRCLWPGDTGRRRHFRKAQIDTPPSPL